MFGKGGALSTWIKEFVELVFIQTLQAFIYAITISFVIKMIIQNHQTVGSVNTSLGIISIVALTAIFQIEDIVRKIMGFGPTKADRQNAFKSLAKTTIAFKLGRNLLDNGKKMVSGGKNVVSGLVDRGKAIKDRKEAETKADEKLNKSNQKAEDYLKEQRMNVRQKYAQQKKDLLFDITAARKAGDKAKVDQLQKEIDKVALSERVSMMKPTKSYEEMISRNKEIYDEKIKSADKELKTKKAEYAKNRYAGYKNMVSGIAETEVAWRAGVAGTIISGADGTWKDAVQDGIAWAGAADKMATGVVNTGADIVGVLNKIRKDLSK